MKYFIAGNIWVLAALAIYLMRYSHHTIPTTVSFLDGGNIHSLASYSVINLIVLVIGFWLLVKSHFSDE